MAFLVKPNLPMRRRIPKTFLVVLALFISWAALLIWGYLNPNQLSIVFLMANQLAGWVFVVIVAVVGALLLGMFVSHRLLTHGGFTPFEEEMLRMRKEVQQQLAHTEKTRDEMSLLRLEVARLKVATRGAEHPEERDAPIASKRHGHGAEAAASASAGEGSEGLDEFGR